jgi:hypothetical protein
LAKFEKKYKPTRGLSDEAVDVVIQNELKELFSMTKFDERDLVKKDKRIRDLLRQQQKSARFP